MLSDNMLSDYLLANDGLSDDIFFLNCLNTAVTF
jgi:hypothetical protein